MSAETKRTLTSRGGKRTKKKSTEYSFAIFAFFAVKIWLTADRYLAGAV
jgi:hypothetical protein